MIFKKAMTNFKSTNLLAASFVFFVLLISASAAEAQNLIVTKTADTNDGVCNADCSLREAITDARSELGQGNIEFSTLFNQPQVIDLTLGELLIDKELTITGKGANLLTIRQTTANSRVFNFGQSGGTINLSGMTISGGNTTANGGAIFIESSIPRTINLTAVHITGNSTSGKGGGIFISGDSGDTVNLIASTVSNNVSTADGFTAGGIFREGGQLNLENSTVSGNRAPNDDYNAGGIYSSVFGSGMFISNSTVTDNLAAGDNGAGGIFAENDDNTSVTLRNSIVAANRKYTTQSDVFAYGNFSSQGYNLIGNAGGANGNFNQIGDQIGDGASPLDPRLRLLAYNGGTTPTHSLRANSPAIDKGKSFGTTTDQNGAPRPKDFTSISPATGGDNSDIGAVELQTLPLSVTKIADTNDGVCNADCSLREAIAAVPNGGVIDLDLPLFNSAQVITLSEATGFQQLSISKSLTINGNAANVLTIGRAAGATPDFRIFNIAGAGITVNLNNLTVAGGRVPTGDGGGINLTGGALLNLNSVVIDGNAAARGGGIRVTDSFLNISDSTISNNSATAGNTAGGIDVTNPGGTQNASLTLTTSTVSGNSATGATVGGGIYLGIPTFFMEPLTPTAISAVITSSTITDNFADPNGFQTAGGIHNDGGSLLVRNTIIAANRNNKLVPDVRNSLGGFSSGGYNLIGNRGGVGFSETGDQSGTPAAPLDPLLAPLAGNGGTTLTHALLNGSPALDKGNSFGLTTDQRGFVRPFDISIVVNAAGGNGSDIGAFEAQAGPTAAAVTIAGRVSMQSGKGLRDARVTLLDSAGNTKIAVTNIFGYFRFDDVTAGGIYVITAASKQYSFTPQIVNVMDNVTELNLIAVGR